MFEERTDEHLQTAVVGRNPFTGFCVSDQQLGSADLVGHWRFDGNLTDSAGADDGTALGDAVVGTNNGRIGGAVAFDGDTDAVTISPDVISGAVFSIAFWEFSAADSNTGYLQD